MMALSCSGVPPPHLLSSRPHQPSPAEVWRGLPPERRGVIDIGDAAAAALTQTEAQ